MHKTIFGAMGNLIPTYKPNTGASGKELRQEDLKVKTSLGYRMKSCLPTAPPKNNVTLRLSKLIALNKSKLNLANKIFCSFSISYNIIKSLVQFLDVIEYIPKCILFVDNTLPAKWERWYVFSNQYLNDPVNTNPQVAIIQIALAIVS